MHTRHLLSAAVALTALSAWTNAQDSPGLPAPHADLESVYPKVDNYSPYANRNFPTNVYWGDTHLHTGMSMDAGAFGARLKPVDAYRFARGDQITSSTGVPVKLSRPLDFLVVADHSDGMGFFPALFEGDPDMLADPTGKRWYDMVHEGGPAGVAAATEIIVAFSQGTLPDAIFPTPGTPIFTSAWEETIDAAEQYNDPGRFTAFIGYEWTSNTAGDNLHRVVIMRDDATRAHMVEPYTTLKPLGSDDPRDLWEWMSRYESKTGGSVLAIPHNGNLSNGIMFPIVDSFTGKPFDLAYAETRAKWEPLYEATQIKGDGETHPFLSPNDEFADYETWDQGNLDLSTPKSDDMLQYEYARSGLQIGLQLEQELGVNPYKFGMIGSTDSHTALATLGIVNVPGPPVEAAIALSIVFVAAEIVRARRGRRPLAERAPWLVAAAFGLLHGLGFAGALSDIGMPQQAVPLALLFFNLGVEIGQLAFVAVVALVIALARRTRIRSRGGDLLLPYAIGSVAMFWVVERVAAF